MSLRDFDTETQTTPWKQVAVQTEVSYVELQCTGCRLKSYVPNRNRPLNRTGSEREYAVCLYCGERLTRGRVIRMPRSWRQRLMFWRKRRMGATLEAEAR